MRTTMLERRIRRALSEGFKEEEIIEKLTELGSDEKEIKKIIDKFDQEKEKAIKSNVKKKKIIAPKKEKTYKTIIDLIFEKIYAEKQIELEILAKLFNVDLDNLNIYLDILKKKNLIEVVYPLFGDPHVKIKGFMKPKLKKRIFFKRGV